LRILTGAQKASAPSGGNDGALPRYTCAGYREGTADTWEDELPEGRAGGLVVHRLKRSSLITER